MTQDTSLVVDSERTKAKVFISYSRKDMAFADRIDAALKARSFEPQIDRSEIYAFEDWWKRIEALIVNADTIVFVLSPDAVASDVCRREVAFAASLNKRFAPIVCRRVDEKIIPESLARLNFIFFTDGSQFEETADKLAAALSTDINWIRKHTEFGEQARRWLQAGKPRPVGLLLRSPVLEEAEHWLATRPSSAPLPTEAMLAFILESRRATTRRRNILMSGLAAGLVVALVLAGLAFWQRGVAIEQESLAIQQRDAAQIAQSRFLTDRATREADAGDAPTGMLLTLAALPDEREEVRRPYVPAAELALSNISQRRWESILLKGHEDVVNSATFSPDGRRVVTASTDTTALIWDAATGMQIAALRGHDDKVWSAAFSPDGRRIVTASQDGTARIWDAAIGAQIAVLKHGDWVLRAAFSADGKRLATASSQGTVRIWDVAMGTQIAAFAAHDSEVMDVAFSLDGRRIVTASEDKTVGIWDATTQAQIATFGRHDGAVNSAAFSPDGRRVVTASYKTAGIWDTASGAQVVMFNGHEGDVTSAAFSPDGQRVVSSSDDGTIRIWDATSGAQITILKGHTGGVRSAAFDPNGLRVVTASADATARIWQVPASAQISVLKGYYDRTNTIAFSPNGRRIVTTSSALSPNATAQIWEVATEEPLAVLKPNDWLSGAAFSHDGKRLVTMSRGGTLRIWDAAGWTQVAMLKGPGDHYNVLSAAFSPDGKRVATTSPDKTAIWDTLGGTELGLKGHDSRVNRVEFSPDGNRVVTASDDTTARIWDAATGAQITVLRGHEGQVWSAAFSPDGRLVVTASADSTARIWNAATAAQITVLRGRDGGMKSAVFFPDSRRVMTTFDREVQIWDVETGAQIALLTEGDQNMDTTALSPDGRYVAAMSWKIGSLSENGKPLMLIWHIFPTTQDLVDDAKKMVPRCLTGEQRERAFLDPVPPAWCVELEKWPYQTQDWKDWLRHKRAYDSPPFPNTPTWQPWIAARRAK
jgi:WD40 repeat protein